ncbi:hypothetical protein DFH11DRAFT_1621685, partial [Phellopilus nigrolimitatus]
MSMMFGRPRSVLISSSIASIVAARNGSQGSLEGAAQKKAAGARLPAPARPESRQEPRHDAVQCRVRGIPEVLAPAIRKDENGGASKPRGSVETHVVGVPGPVGDGERPRGV